MSEIEYNGLEDQRMLFIQERLFELKEIINHNKAELEAAEKEKEKLSRELKRIKRKFRQSEEN